MRMSSTPKSGKYVQEDDPSSPPPPTGGKPPSKGGTHKLARRARSFKDDFLGKISQMRTPPGGAGRALRPEAPRLPPAQGGRGPAHDLEELRRQIRVALKHFRDVIYKKKLEMLPGNGTIVLDTVWQINLAVKNSENALVEDATTLVHRRVARLIQLCDDVLIDAESSELDAGNVDGIVQQAEDAIENLINLALENLPHHQTNCKTAPRLSYCSSMETQRNSLPDIPLTSKDMESIGKKSCATLASGRNSHSTESILRDSSPPPKPPLPERLRLSNCITPPPLPPKKKQVRLQHLTDAYDSPRSNGCERLSLRSKSPDDSVSLQSESVGSLDSMLNHSRDEDEVDLDINYDENHTSDILGTGPTTTNPWEDASLSCIDYHRLSNADSGIASMRSSGYSRASRTSTASSAHIVHHVTTKQTTFQSNVETTCLETNFSHSSSSSSSSVVLIANSSRDESPPAVPEKTKRKTDRQPSPYDDVADGKFGELVITCERHQSHHSLTSGTTVGTGWGRDSSEPPPLPPKKKHIMAYMEMFGNCSHTNNQEFLRHSVHMVHAQYGQPIVTSLPTARSCAFSRQGQNFGPAIENAMDERSPSPSQPPALPPKQRARKASTLSAAPDHPKPPLSPALLPDLLEHTANSEERSSSSPSSAPEDAATPEEDLMEALDVDKYLLRKKENEEGPDVRGGPVDALIIQATKATKNGVFVYQEAFLTTYRTFISPKELIVKLMRRFNHFYFLSENKLSREAFALIVRVVSDLTTLDLDEALQLQLMSFVQRLIASGELTLAKALRVKQLQRHEAKLLAARPAPVFALPALAARAPALLDFKSEQIAEQMTLLDAELFMKIEIPEVLMWAQEQNEERSPNLTRFTEHFNKMSYWARTRILTAEGKDTREKYFSKFIKIMKHLRKINNFNSYLALLSALDSAPVRRLEWQKQVQEGLKDYCALIDSSSSFRAYRMALAETQPPCIPYIGLILQDLTFVHIGNTNLLSEGIINFSKRWQQFNILENMKKFKKETYAFKKQERIISFFQGFDDFIGEEKMWKLSETIKPRGKKTPH